MTRFAQLVVVCGLFAAGCNKETTATAPSKDPGKPNTPRKLTVKSPAARPSRRTAPTR